MAKVGDKRIKGEGHLYRKGNRTEQRVMKTLHRHGYLADRQTAISGATGTISGIPDDCGDLRTGILLNNAEIGAEIKFRKAAEGFSTLWRWLRSPFVDVLYLIKEGRPEALVLLRESAWLLTGDICQSSINSD